MFFPEFVSKLAHQESNPRTHQAAITLTARPLGRNKHAEVDYLERCGTGVPQDCTLCPLYYKQWTRGHENEKCYTKSKLDTT